MNRPAGPPRAVVLLSGGLDSATVLALARESGRECFCLSVDYGQRHRAELTAARRVAIAGGALRHEIVHLDVGRLLSGSSLTDPSLAVPTDGPGGGIPSTYVPARNTMMLALALGWAESLGATEIHYGANAVDYSGYPDCRPDFVAAFQSLVRQATRAGIEGAPPRIVAPIIAMTKARIIREGLRLGVDFAQTVSCYQADDDGRACGACDACRLRRDGFIAAGVPDPTRYA